MNEDLLGDIISDLLASYNLDQRSEHAPQLPAREAVVGVLEQIQRLLFPGYYADEPLPHINCRYRVGIWLCELHTDLARVLRMATHYAEPDADLEPLSEQAQALAARLCADLPAIREQLREDAQAALDGDPAACSFEEIILTYPGFEAITVHRIAHWLYCAKVPFVPRVMTEYAHARTGIDIHPGAQIGRRFFIDHGTGVVVGETATIGDNVKVYQGVTLGALSVRRSLAGKKRHPNIEDGVILYAGATVLGGQTTIGKDSIIGGNVWITESVAAGTTVIESPPTLDFKGPKLSQNEKV